MKKIIPATFALLYFVTCREKPAVLTEPLFLTFYTTTSSSLCDPDSGTVSEDNRGSLVLLTNTKALYALKDSDSIHYFRGTYRLADDGINCTFDAEYDHARATVSKSRKVKTKSHTAMRPVKAWGLSVGKTGCSNYAYFSDKGNLRTPGEDSLKLLYREADPSKAAEYINRINGIAALVDFHMELPPAVKAANYAGSDISGPIEKYYTGANRKAILKRAEDDSSVKLTFSYKKVPAGEDGGPFLFVTIPKSRSAMLSGDVSGDGEADLVVQPVLSQGGASQWKEMFVFVKNGQGYQLSANASNFDLAQYRGNSHSGCFHAREIKDGKILGTSLCYRDDDAQCCPSVTVPTRVVLQDGRITSYAMR